VGPEGQGSQPALYQLLGGRSRDGVMVYGHANGNDIAETLDEVARYVDMGYKAIRAQCGVPGLPSTYGVASDKLYYEPADSALPTENVWSTTRIWIMPRNSSKRFERASVRSPHPARCASSPHADRGRPARQVAGTL
jgi:hypothetical protein